MGVDDYPDNVKLRGEWEKRTGGSVTLDESVTPPLWRARDAGNGELVHAHDLGVVMDFLGRLGKAQRRREAFQARHPQARFWTSGADAGPARWHGSLPVGADRIESGPHRELGDLMDIMDALAGRAREMLRAALP